MLLRLIPQPFNVQSLVALLPMSEDSHVPSPPGLSFVSLCRLATLASTVETPPTSCTPRSSDPTPRSEEGGDLVEEEEGGAPDGENEEPAVKSGVDNRDETMGVSLGRVAQGHIIGVSPAFCVVLVPARVVFCVRHYRPHIVMRNQVQDITPRVYGIMY